MDTTINKKAIDFEQTLNESQLFFQLLEQEAKKLKTENQHKIIFHKNHYSTHSCNIEMNGATVVIPHAFGNRNTGEMLLNWHLHDKVFFNPADKEYTYDKQRGSYIQQEYLKQHTFSLISKNGLYWQDVDMKIKSINELVKYCFEVLYNLKP